MKRIEYFFSREELIKLVKLSAAIKGDWKVKLSAKGLRLWKDEK